MNSNDEQDGQKEGKAACMEPSYGGYNANEKEGKDGKKNFK